MILFGVIDFKKNPSPAPFYTTRCPRFMTKDDLGRCPVVRLCELHNIFCDAQSPAIQGNRTIAMDTSMQKDAIQICKACRAEFKQGLQKQTKSR